MAVLGGPVYIPTPSWVSYLPQARILKKEVIAMLTDKSLIEDILKIAGSTYSCVAAPIQYAAIAAYWI